MNVLIAYDGSERSEAALDDLRRAGLGDHVHADVVSVAEVWIPTPNEYAGPSLIEMAVRDIAEKGRQELDDVTRRLEQAGQRLRALFPDWTVTTHAKTGPAGLRIIELADRLAPDLVVVGAQGHAVAADRLAIGSVALKVLTHLRCPVRIARPLHGRPDHLRILVAADGSIDADAALAAVAGRAWRAGTEARVVTCIHHPALSIPTSHPMRAVPFNAAMADKIAASAAERLRVAGLQTSTHVVSGDPKRALIDTAREWGADCIFCGARGMSRAERFVLGSVSTSVAMHAPCSVDVIHSKAA